MNTVFQNIVDLELLTNDSTNPATARWDLLDSSFVLLDVLIGTRVNSNTAPVTISVLRSDNATANFVTVCADRSELPLTVPHIVRYAIDTRDGKRYLKLATTPGTSTNDAVTIGGVLQRSRVSNRIPTLPVIVEHTTDGVIVR